jgi:hypothetical protein
MAKQFPLHPKHPERICWGCDKYCAAKDLMCGNGSGRTQHPAEMLGMTGINGVIGALRMRLTRQPMNRIILEQAG